MENRTLKFITVNFKCFLHRSHWSLHICTPASFSRYRISSLHFSFISSSLPTPNPVFFCSVFSPVGRQAPMLTGLSPTTLTAHYSFFFMPSHCFHANTKARTHPYATISPCQYNTLEEWKHQRGVSFLPWQHEDKRIETYHYIGDAMRICIWGVRNVCFHVKSVEIRHPRTFQFPVLIFAFLFIARKQINAVRLRNLTTVWKMEEKIKGEGVGIGKWWVGNGRKGVWLDRYTL